MRTRGKSTSRHGLSGLIVLGLTLGCMGSFAFAESTKPAGWVEKVRLEPHGIPLKAKLDTGAKTSSLHAENIERFSRDGQKWVRFEMTMEDANGDPQQLKLEKRRVRGVRIKEHEGEYDRRSVVEMSFCLGGERYSTEFTLVDRSRFIYPVLLGRRFLAGFAPVDASKTFTRTLACPEMTEPQP